MGSGVGFHGDGLCAQLSHGQPCGDKCVRRHQNLVARPDPRGAERQRDRIEPVSRADAVGCPGIGGERRLELSEFIRGNRQTARRDDEIVTGILSDRLDEDDVKGGFILDGYPRTEAQAHSLDELLAAERRDGRNRSICIHPDDPRTHAARHAEGAGAVFCLAEGPPSLEEQKAENAYFTAKEWLSPDSPLNNIFGIT